MKMKTLLLTTVAVLALGGVANATDFACGAPQFSVGHQSHDPQDTVDRIEIRHASNSPEWQVHHRFQNGTMIMRQEQYAMIDASNPNFWAWRGRLKRNGNITMVGEIHRDYRGQITYTETQQDRGRVTMQTSSVCNVMTAVAGPGPYQPLPQPQPPGQAPAPIPNPPIAQPAPPPPAPAPEQPKPIIIVVPTPAPIAIPTTPEPKVEKVEPPKVEQPKVEPPKPAIGKISSIPVNIQNNNVTLNVSLGSETVSMVLDTGATHTSVTSDVADRLVRSRQARWDGQARIKLADGSIKTEQALLIYEVKVGRHIVRNVTASVSASETMLLGFSVLNEIGSFMIDKRNNELVFVTVEAKAETNTQTDAAPPPVASSSTDEFWPEGTGISNECGREMNKYMDPKTGDLPADLKSKISPECYANLERWSAQLTKNLKNPAFKKQLEDIITRAGR